MISKNENPEELAEALEKCGLRLRESPAVCHCIGVLYQRCHVCDPDGTMYGVVRPELCLRIDV